MKGDTRSLSYLAHEAFLRVFGVCDDVPKGLRITGIQKNRVAFKATVCSIFEGVDQCCRCKGIPETYLKHLDAIC